MSKIGRILLLSVWLPGFLAACAAPTNQPAVISPFPPTATALSATATATTVPPTDIPVSAPVVGLTEIHMFSEQGGWALSARPDGNSHLLHTADGGQAWSDVTPSVLPPDILTTSFLDAASAWAFDYNTPSNGLAHTDDGGKTWTLLPALPIPQDFSGARITFIDPKNGWFETGNPGAGSVDLGFFTTRDGGVSWTQVQLTAPPDQPDMSLSLIPGTLHLCMMCHDLVYFDQNRVMILYGDLNDPGNPSGKLSLSLSTDAGKTWHNLQLAPPSDNLTNENVAPMLPAFFDQKNGLLAYGFVKYDPALSIGTTQLVIFATHDGGLNWKSFANSVVQNVDVLKAQDVVDYISPEVAFVPCGNDLCATHDGAQTWQTLKSNLNFVPADGTEYVQKIDFVSSTVGWALTVNGDDHHLWKTVDGGASWIKLSPNILSR